MRASAALPPASGGQSPPQPRRRQQQAQQPQEARLARARHQPHRHEVQRAVRVGTHRQGQPQDVQGNTMRLEKALERMPAAELDSSDEELANLLELGKQGK